jgi:UDPglucose--hexose-1-phosphate uridylyltransferase
MNETRYDWLTDRWVIFAPNREERPDEFRQNKRPMPTERIDCPFCSGAEHETPEPTLVLPELDFDATTSNRRVSQRSPRPAWQVRVVPNKFPAVPNCSSNTLSTNPRNETEGERIHPQRSLDSSSGLEQELQLQTLGADHLFQKHVPMGAHEVIIEAPSHVDSVTSLSTDQISLILEAYRRRLNHWRAQRGLKYAVVFKNYGADAGASLVHSHSQLISLDFVPRDIERINERLTLHYNKYGRCYICQIVDEEGERNERVLLSTNGFVALCPFASRFPFSFTIVPRTHRSCFEEIAPHELHDLATVVKATLSALESAQPSAAYNFVLQTSPFRSLHEEAFHWRLRVIPRLSKVAGFEWGSDCFINTITPEHAARVLRAHLDPNIAD